MRFERTINLGHVAVLAGLLINAGVALSDAVRWRERVDSQMADTQRRVADLEATVAKLTENLYWLKENLAVLTELQRRMEREMERQ